MKRRDMCGRTTAALFSSRHPLSHRVYAACIKSSQSKRRCCHLVHRRAIVEAEDKRKFTTKKQWYLGTEIGRCNERVSASWVHYRSPRAIIVVAVAAWLLLPLGHQLRDVVKAPSSVRRFESRGGAVDVGREFAKRS